MDMPLVVAIAVFAPGTMRLRSSPSFVKPADVRPGAPARSRGLLGTSLFGVAGALASRALRAQAVRLAGGG